MAVDALLVLAVHGEESLLGIMGWQDEMSLYCSALVDLLKSNKSNNLTYLVDGGDERVGQGQPQADVGKGERHQTRRDEPSNDVGHNPGEFVDRCYGGQDSHRHDDGDTRLDALDGGGGGEPQAGLQLLRHAGVEVEVALARLMRWQGMGMGGGELIGAYFTTFRL